jgi:hypothetical protein
MAMSYLPWVRKRILKKIPERIPGRILNLSLVTG